MRSWLGWLLKKRHIFYNPASGLELPREQKCLPANVLSEGETRNIFTHQETTSLLGVRNRAIMETFYSSGRE